MTPQNHDETGDAGLIRSVQAGDLDAFAPLVRRHLPVVRAFVALRLPVANVADEITHETFVLAFRHLGEFDSRKPIRPWLRAIAWNLVRAELKRFAREQANLSRLEQLQFARFSERIDSETAPDDAAYLEECLNELPDNVRRLIDARYEHGLSTDELSAAFSRTAEWVRVTLFRVRKQLRACIENKAARNPHV